MKLKKCNCSKFTLIYTVLLAALNLTYVQKKEIKKIKKRLKYSLILLSNYCLCFLEFMIKDLFYLKIL